MSADQVHESVEIDLDLSGEEIRDWGGEPGWQPPKVAPGEYTLDVIGVVQHTAKSSGNSSLKVTFAVADGEFAGEELVGYYATQGKGVSRLKRLMMCVGARLDKVRTDEILGGKLLATVTHENMPPQKNPDGSVKTDPNTGEPYAPSVSAKVLNERPTEQAKAAATTKAATPPPVTRGANNANNKAQAQTRRA